MYMPPEQLESAKDVDRRADVYAFGAVIFEILTGNPPFTADSMSSLCMKILSEAPEPPSRIRPDCPPELDRIVLKCLEKEKDHRFPGFEEIEKELEAIIPSSAQSIVPPPRQSQRTGRSPSAPSRMARSGVRSAPGSVSSASSSAQGRGSDSGGVTLIEGILFLDMVASTARGTKYGDSLILQIKEELRQIVETESNRFSATFTKGMGDGYMITFPDAESAARAGCNIMRRLSARNQASPRFRRIDLRMGIHFGEVHLDSAGDRQGSSVNMASRLQSVGAVDFHQTQAGIDLDQLSEENRIFISEAVNEELAEHKHYNTRLVGFFDLKGFTGRHRVFEVLWK
jgi:class 3 adenylate cyclase